MSIMQIIFRQKKAISRGWHTLKSRIGKGVILQGIDLQVLREL